MLALLLMLAAEPTPTAAASPSPTPAAGRTPVPATGQFGRPRTLSDVARERKLATGKGTGSVSVASGSESGAAKPTPSLEGGALPVPPDESPQPHLVVESVRTNDTVGGRGETGVFGRIRNSGSAPACNVRVAIKVFDDHSVYLASGEAPADQSLIKAGETVSFATTIQLPPGVAGPRREKYLGYGTTGGGGTLEGQWRTLGAAEAAVSSFSTSCSARPLKTDE
jgi:hypothetical protein